jgi:hypothetical protein
MVWSKKSLCHFQQICKFKHFAKSEAKPNYCEDRRYRVRPVLHSIVGKFQQVYVPEKQISIALDMIAWKGQLIYSIKAYLICESQSGYIYNVLVYTEKSRPVKKNQVLELVSAQLHNKGYHLYQDNRIEYGRAGTTMTMHFDRYRSFVQPFSSFIQQSLTLKKVQYLTDRDVFKVTWFRKVTTQVPESECGQSLTITKNM